MQDLHGDLVLSVVKLSEFLVLDGNVFLDILVGELDLLVLARAIHGRKCPVRDCRGRTTQQEHEDVCFEAATADQRQNGLQDIWHDNNGGGKVEVVEITIAFGQTGERGVLDGWVVRRLHCVGRHGR